MSESAPFAERLTASTSRLQCIPDTRYHRLRSTFMLACIVAGILVAALIVVVRSAADGTAALTSALCSKVHGGPDSRVFGKIF
jgi:hypothetical protein